MPQGVVDDVADHPAELGLVAEHDGPLQGAGVQGHARWDVPPGAVGHHPGEVHRHHLFLCAPVKRREHEEVVEGAGKALVACQELPDERVAGGVRVLLGDLEGRGEAGERRAELVRRVRDEPALPFGGALE